MSRGAALSDIAAVSDIKDMWAVKFAYFSDPDGNCWAPQEMAQQTTAKVRMAPS